MPNSDGVSDGLQCRRTFVTDFRPISDENKKFEIVGIPSAISDEYPRKHEVNSTTERPRMCVFRSNKHLYVQVIDDTKMHTLPSASTKQKPISGEFEYTSGPTINLRELTHMFGNLIDTPVNLSYPRTILSRINPNKHRRMVEEAKCVGAFVTLKVGD
ncbi:50S ribosomal protein L18, chloroplastic isoform X3 [Brassica napus]|uniref:50S ribosomal protein L18, chloroplastic isoform X3 n=1 Tax=Brassica napus TaxID=3708 RepID=UPI00207A0F58|nr:50S ribosomal protein L18, chloroplastic isoform X3 [Brassica napus]